ncbi:phospholipase A and acyltransferase 2-like isoform X2 [Lithobates pipiens]
MPLVGPKPEIGDLIAFEGVLEPYDHWGIYVGDGKVVHIQARKILDDIFKLDTHIAFRDRAKVEIGKLEEVAGGRKYRVNNMNDWDMTPYEANIIFKRAISAVGKEFGYNVIGKNCEHFVNVVRYGEEYSKQTPVDG